MVKSFTFAARSKRPVARGDEGAPKPLQGVGAEAGLLLKLLLGGLLHALPRIDPAGRHLKQHLPSGQAVLADEAHIPGGVDGVYPSAIMKISLGRLAGRCR